jgi:hypothetical protein
VPSERDIEPRDNKYFGAASGKAGTASAELCDCDRLLRNITKSLDCARSKEGLPFNETEEGDEHELLY